MDNPDPRVPSAIRSVLRMVMVVAVLAAAVFCVHGLTGYPLRLSVDLHPTAKVAAKGYGVEFRLPARITFKPDVPERFSGKVYEDGRLLGKRSKSKRTVQEKGEGRYWIQGGKLCLSASDNSDPLVNGRHYEIRAAWRHGYVPAAVALALALLVLGVLVATGADGQSPGQRLAREGAWLGCRLRSHHLAALWRRAREPRCGACLLAMAFVAMAGFRLYAMAAEEIWASPFDPLGYASIANNPGLIRSHPPGGALAYRYFFTQFGVPARLGYEILYGVATALFAMGAGRAMKSRLLAVVLFGLFVLFPAPPAFRNFAVEPFLFFCLTSAAGCLMLAHSDSRGWKNPYLWLAGLAFGFWQASRAELPLVAATAAGCGMVFGLARATAPLSRWRENLRDLAPGSLLLACVLASHLGTSVYFWSTNGIAAKSGMEVPGSDALLNALYRIKAPDTFPFAPVTHKTLEMACDASPTLHSKAKVLLNKQADGTLAGQYITKKPGEPGTFLNILVWEAFINQEESAPGKSRSGKKKESPESVLQRWNAEMLAAAAELREAMARGELPHRRAFYPLDPEWHHWAPNLPSVFSRAFSSLAKIPPYKPQNDPLLFGQYETMDTFWVSASSACDTASLRRRALLGFESIDLDFALGGDNAGIHTAALVYRGYVLASSPPKSVFAGIVPKAHPPILIPPAEGKTDSPAGKLDFTLRTRELPAPPAESARLVLCSDTGPVADVDLKTLKTGSTATAKRTDTGGALSITDCKATRRNPGLGFMNRQDILTKLPKVFRAWFFLACAATFLAGCKLDGTARQPAVRALACGTMVWAVILLLRLVFYTIVEANLGWGFERYIEPHAPLFYGGAALLPAWAGLLLRAGWQRARRLSCPGPSCRTPIRTPQFPKPTQHAP